VTVPSNNTQVSGKHYQHFDEETLNGTLRPSFEPRSVFFLNRMCMLERCVGTLLQNRFFVLNEPRVLNRLYRLYCRFAFRAYPSNCRRLAGIFSPSMKDVI